MPESRPIPLRRRVDLLIAVSVVIAVIIAIVVGSAVLTLRSALATSRNVVAPAGRQAQALVTGLIDQETGARGYVITGKAAFLAPYADGRNTEASAAAALRTTLRAYPDLLADLSTVGSSAAQWRAQAADPEIEAVRAHDVTRQRTLTDAELGRQLFDKVRASADRLQAGVRDLQSASSSRVSSAQHRVEVALLVGGIVVIVLLVAARVLFVRWIEAPVRALSRGVQDVEAGRQGSLALDETPPPEFARLRRDVESMRARLAAEVEETRRANEALRQQGPAVVALREQLLPSRTTIPTMRVAGRLQPAEGVLAGDWYDVMDLGGGRWCVVVVDVSGHGPGAGTLALRLKTLLDPALRTCPDPGDALRWLANGLRDWDESFATCALVVGDDSSATLRYTSAGHPPALLWEDGEWRALEPTGPLLSPMTASLGWHSRRIELTAASRLLLYTDGAVECRDAAGRQFGEQRLFELLASLDPRADADTLVEACLDGVRRHCGDDRRDDRTLVVLEPIKIAASIGATGAQMGTGRAC